MEAAARTALPAGYAFEWTGLSLQQQQAGGQVLIIFALGIVFVFLVLAAPYESFALPLVVMLVGLSSKNAILIFIHVLYAVVETLRSRLLKRREHAPPGDGGQEQPV